MGECKHLGVLDVAPLPGRPITEGVHTCEDCGAVVEFEEQPYTIEVRPCPYQDQCTPGYDCACEWED